MLIFFSSYVASYRQPSIPSIVRQSVLRLNIENDKLDQIPWIWLSFGHVQKAECSESMNRLHNFLHSTHSRFMQIAFFFQSQFHFKKQSNKPLSTHLHDYYLSVLHKWNLNLVYFCYNVEFGLKLAWTSFKNSIDFGKYFSPESICSNNYLSNSVPACYDILWWSKLSRHVCFLSMKNTFRCLYKLKLTASRTKNKYSMRIVHLLYFCFWWMFTPISIDNTPIWLASKVQYNRLKKKKVDFFWIIKIRNYYSSKQFSVQNIDWIRGIIPKVWATILLCWFFPIYIRNNTQLFRI